MVFQNRRDKNLQKDKYILKSKHESVKGQNYDQNQQVWDC